MVYIYIKQYIFIILVKNKEIQIIPYTIGNSLGSCSWFVTVELFNFMYLVNFNHTKERFNKIK